MCLSPKDTFEKGFAAADKSFSQKYCNAKVLLK